MTAKSASGKERDKQRVLKIKAYIQTDKTRNSFIVRENWRILKKDIQTNRQNQK